jgi:hypothetical protein
MNSKLENFPSVNYTSLYESIDRRDFMESQMKYFGIKRVNSYLTERFINLYDIEITGYHIDQITHLGAIVSQLNLMRNWYNSCNEPYSIFCEDDISFESIHYWNFTWNEFIENLPKDWGCVQLMRMVSPWSEDAEQQLQIDLRPGRWWGSHSLMRREYVKRLLEKTCVGINKYHLEVWQNNTSLLPIIENVLFLMDVGKVYNIPFLIEDDRFNTTFNGKLFDAHRDQNNSHQKILNQWKTKGSILDIKDIMTIR